MENKIQISHFKKPLIIAALLGALFLLNALINSSTTKELSNNALVGDFQELNVPPLLEYTMIDGVKNYELSAQKGEYEFIEGVISHTYGYNGDILGPTIRFSESDRVNIHVKNNLDEKTTTHWHGGVVPGDADGGVHNIIPAGEDWDARFDVIQEAATLWYHPHQHEETARQVYMGLGGFIIIDDENSENLSIPQEYGVDDFPVILQSKTLDSNGRLSPYRISHMDEMHGFRGNTLLVNAQIKPHINATTNLVRLRILNGSNADTYNLSLSNGAEFSVIASDGGFYDTPIRVNHLKSPTAKRYEILVDVSGDLGESIWLNVNGQDQLEIRVAESLDEKYEIPTITNVLIPPAASSKIDRQFNLELLRGGGPPTYGINGKLFDMERMDFETQNGTVEYWKVKNINSGMAQEHPFHIHATQFYVMEFNGQEPSPLMLGRHDTILLKAGDEAILAVPFDKTLEGMYLYHCHILEHEDAGMMGQFTLQKQEQ